MKDRPILLLAIAQMLVWACLYYSFPGLLLHWEASLGWSRSDLTAAITLAIFVSAFCSPLYGKLIDSGNGAIMMTGAAALGGVCLILLSQVTQLWQFYLIWGAIGVCMAFCLYEPCFALLTRARGADAKGSIIFVTLVAGFAGTVSFPIAHSMVTAFGWRSAVLLFGMIAIVIVAPLMWCSANPIEQAGSERLAKATTPAVASRSFMKSAVFWCLALAFCLAAASHGITLHHLLPILDERGVHPEVAVLAISFIGPMQVAGRLVMMATQNYVSNHGVVISCFVLMGMSMLFLIGSGFTPMLLVGFVILFGGAYGMVSIIRPVIARELLGENQFGAKSGALAMVYLVGSASAPLLGALVWSIGGYELVLPGLIGIVFVGLTLYLVAQKQHRNTA
ncbi:MAG: MFS transporter [Pseudomonadota bacterium]